MRALITGITGFAGGFLAEHLLSSGDECLGSSTRGAWSRESPAEVQRRVELLPWDIGSEEGLSPAARQRIEAFSPNCIYHLAAISIPAQCGADRPTAIATAVNVGGTERVLRLARDLSGRCRVLLISTSHVYAPGTVDHFRLAEDWPLGPRRGYGLTKQAAEEAAQDAVRQHGADVVIARAFQHTGPRQQPQMMLPEWASQVVANPAGPIVAHNCDAWIDLTDVRDVVRAYRLLVEKAEPGGIYNVGSGQSRRSGDILQMLLRQAGVRPDVEVRQTHPGRKQDPIADIGRLTALTGWQPGIPLEQTVADTLDDWRRRELNSSR